jgi:hypothetical protein
VDWKLDTEGIDWNELSALYRMAPLGEKKPDDLRTAFSNSYGPAKRRSLDHQSPTASLGFRRIRTAMAIFENQERAVQTGLVEIQ